MKLKLKIVIATLFLGTLIGLAPQFIQAQTTGPTEGDAGGFVVCGNKVDDPCDVSDLFKVFKIIVNYLIVMSGLVAIVAIIYSALLMVTAAGTDRLAAAKKRLSGAIIGIIIVAAAFVLINALFDGSFSVGVRNGAKILTDPACYIDAVNCN